LPSGRFEAITLDFTQLSPIPHHKSLFMWMAQRILFPFDKIICESFQFHKDKRDKEFLDYQAGEYVGVVKLFAQMNEVPYIMQAPAVKEQFWTDDKLKRVALYPFLKDKHQRDAARHWLQHDTFTMNNQEWLYKLKA
jgi:hypothetical protein